MTAHETVLAIDYGLRNMGVAVGNTMSGTAQPLAIINARDGVPDWDALAKLIEAWQPHRVVVGHPLNMDGTESEISERVMKFARQVEGRYQRTVTLVAERRSSREAKAAALASGHDGDFAAKPIDDEAAAIILSTWLNEQ